MHKVSVAPAPVPVSGLIPEKNDVIVTRGVATAGTGGVGAADSFGSLWWGTAVASMLVSISVPVAGEWYPPDYCDHFGAWYYFQSFPVGGVVFNVPPVIK